ncbi:carbohydrate esterase family 1 protein [Aulographum hederae CBS 113979]|uniref:feruloyl esterase n=1 Tax=Aulographum hederae CBS 113979 TaxID=1176131 RepID=A0A6G1H1N0_9PEZI|nr:carbohydrate esterase family 1 protein [Aulographum hederae CBS 113979]
MQPLKSFTLALLASCFQFLDIAYAATPSSGCGRQIPGNINLTASTNVSIISGGFNRSYLFHLPKAYDIDTPAPLIFSYHGRTRSAEQQEGLSQFSNSSYNKDAIAVYPQGSQWSKNRRVRQWQGDPVADPEVDDIKFTLDMIDAIKSDFCIDTSRIYAAGKSNGGGLVNLLACDPRSAPVFAAYAPVSGAFYLNKNKSEPRCNPGVPLIPMMEFHGTGDETISYDGNNNDSDSRGPTFNIPTWLAEWKERDDCDRKNTTKTLCGEGTDSPEVTRYEWTCRGEKDALVHYRIDGWGHDWPSTFANNDTKKTICFDATRVIMKWFGTKSL